MASTITTPTVGAATLRPDKRKRSHTTAAYLFVTPFFVVFVGMLVVPLGYAAYLSLFQSKLIGGETFAWFANYAEALTDPEFLGGIGRMTIFLLVQVPIMLGLSLFLALGLDSGRAKGSKVLRLLYFMPYAVPGVVATLMWGYIYGPDFGIIAQTFDAFDLTSPNFLTADTILASMMNIVTWEYVGYNMIIMYAALRAIPTELYEAAEIDGASQLRIAWSIKIPSIRPAIMLTVIFSVIGTFQLFNEPSLLDAIAPTAISNGFTPNFYAYNVAFINQNLNYAAAVAFLLGLFIAVISYVVQLRGSGGSRKRKARA